MRCAEASRAWPHQPLLHAQDIILELNASLKVDAWDGAAGLASLYDYLLTELTKANVAKDLRGAEFCLHLATSLRDTWRDAAGSLLAESA